MTPASMPTGKPPCKTFAEPPKINGRICFLYKGIFILNNLNSPLVISTLKTIFTECKVFSHTKTEFLMEVVHLLSVIPAFQAGD